MATSAAKRYAQAIVSLAKEQSTFEAWDADLERLNELMSDPETSTFLVSPTIDIADRDRVLFGQLEGVRPETINLVKLLAQRQRLEMIPELYRLFQEAVLEERGYAIAEVTTAEPLGPEEQEVVKGQLKRLVGKEIELRLKTDPEIIGGIVARIGDQLIDGSVINQLRQLRARLATV